MYIYIYIYIKSQHTEATLQNVFVGDHNLTFYNHSKNRPTWCDVEGHKRFEYVFLIIN